MKFKIRILLLVFLIILTNCSLLDKKDEEKSTTIPKKELIVNPQIKAKEFVNKGGGILGDFSRRSGNTTYNFATSNVMWRASLNSLKFMPLQSVDYAGGLLITDWYSADNSLDSKESIKISIRFLSDKVSANSFEITSHKKICNKNLQECKVMIMNNSFSNQIKDKIMKEVTMLSIEDEKNKTNKE